MVNQILSFEEILEREEYVLVDTSVSGSKENSGWYRKFVYDADSFSDIDEGVFRERIIGLDFFNSFLRNSNIYTSRGVSFEIENGRNMVQEKIRYLEDRASEDSFLMEFSDRGVFRRRLRRKDHNSNGTEPPQKELLREIQNLYHKAYVQSRRAVLETEEENTYEYLENLVLKVTEHTNAKKDFGPRYGEFVREDKEDFHTDEQLVSLALYSSVMGNESCIITRDSDFERILNNTLSYLLHSDNHFSSDYLLKFFQENRIQIFYPISHEEGKIVLDTSRPESITRLPPEQIEKVNQALAA